MEPGQNVMIAHMTTQVEMGMKEWKKKTKKPKQAKVSRCVNKKLAWIYRNDLVAAQS